MSGIFISYRRDDSQGTTGRLYDDLKDHFGKDRVFRDLDNIAPGVEYADAILEFIESCDAVLVVIGNRWLDIRDAQGHRRLGDRRDLVRQEVIAALKTDKLVIPVLVEDAKMPEVNKLPPTLAPLVRRNGVKVSDARWDYDIGRLVSNLGQVIPPRSPAPPTNSRESSEARSSIAPPPTLPDRTFSADSSSPQAAMSSDRPSGSGWSRPTPPAPPEVRTKGWRNLSTATKAAIVGLTALFVLAVVGFIMVRPTDGGGPRKAVSVIVPDVAGKPDLTAFNILARAGLYPAGVDTEDNSSVPVAHVIRTDPPAGSSVPEGTLVTMILSNG